MSPYVTVLMPVYNGEKYLKEAVDSILNQTFEDFEFLIIDDGSTDRSLEILKSYKDPRIRIFQNEKNIGLIKSLNKGLKLTQGKYIARMDADDISLPERLEKQITFMDVSPKIGVCGTWLQTFGEIKKTVVKSPLNHEDICARMFCDNSIWHPTVIFRKDIIDRYHLFYDENVQGCEDYKLWVEMAKVTILANLPEVLLLYRIHGFQVTKLGSNSQDIKNDLVENFLGRLLTNHEKRCHESLHFARPHSNIQLIQDVDEWVDFLKKLNASNKKYEEPIFSQALDKVKKEMYKKSFYYSTRYNKRYNPFLLFRLFLSKQKYFLYFPVIELLKACIKCFILWPNKNFHHKKV